MSKETNGPAFPTNAHNYGDGMYAGSGMTLRDYFAAKAMQALILRDEPCIPRDSYRLADLMLEAREQ